jgi:hypothetical protein
VLLLHIVLRHGWYILSHPGRLTSC